MDDFFKIPKHRVYKILWGLKPAFDHPACIGMFARKTISNEKWVHKLIFTSKNSYSKVRRKAKGTYESPGTL